MGFFSSLLRGKPRTYSSNFSSYRSLRSGQRKPFEPKQSPAERKKQGGFFYKAIRVLKIFAVFALVSGLAYLSFFTSLFEIQKIEVTGNEATAAEQSTLNESLQEHLGRNLLIFKTRELEQKLFEEYPYLRKLNVGRDFFHTLTVNLETYENLANVRVDFENGTQQLYVVNELGFVSGTGSSTENLPTLVMDVTGTDLDWTALETLESEESPETTEGPEPIKGFLLNQELIEAEVLKKLLKATEDFEGKFNMQILEIHYLKQARELHLVTERYFTVWIDLTQDPALQLAKLKKALSTLNIYEADLEYIDLRISGQNGEKVIYKSHD
ncbi:FtsQ-type POTRA domain-containing protein [Candidatus Peregrinibacteria bacterium]|nr:MAG: FtsQ-type POTRA domain-containing protein [Candidatus Peregrinibacteria bacterium]